MVVGRWEIDWLRMEFVYGDVGSTGRLSTFQQIETGNLTISTYSNLYFRSGIL